MKKGNKRMGDANIKSKMGIVQLGGISSILSGLLFLILQLFVLPIPRVPLGDEALLLWVKEWKLQYSMADELLFFAAVLLLPAVAAMYQVLSKTDKLKALLGCGLFAITIPILMILVVVLGRLVYPVYDLVLSPESYRLVLSLYYGGQHCVSLIMGIAIILLSIVIRKTAVGKIAAYLGFLAGILAILGSYPWLVSNGTVFAIQLVFSAWLVLMGIRMLDKSVYES